MKTKFFLSILALGVIVTTFGQNTIELTFTAIDSADYEQLDSIKVMNRTQGGDTVLYYPDTVLVLDYHVGISETIIETKGFQVFQNYPNPVIDQTTVSFYVPERDEVSLIVTDMLGRVVIKTERTLNQGYHSYQFTPGNGSIFLLTVQWKEYSSSIKILHTNPASNISGTLEYIGGENSSLQLKASSDIQSFPFSLGDELLYIGFIDTLQSGKLETPEANVTYTFQFATNIPCLGTPTVEYEGQVYNTIQIFSQCWLKENLNVGTLITKDQTMADNDTIEKYCYNNVPDSCTKYGGLYTWDEMMQYTDQRGTQGICPPGWHLPTDEEWKLLEGAVDGQYDIGDTHWDVEGWLGTDIGEKIKSTNGWHNNGNGTNSSGFNGQPAGRYDLYFMTFNSFSFRGGWWTSSELLGGAQAWYRGLRFDLNSMVRVSKGKVPSAGYSVRCLKN